MLSHRCTLLYDSCAQGKLVLAFAMQLDTSTGMGVVYLQHEVGPLKVNGTRCATGWLQADDLEIHQICEWKRAIWHGVYAL